LSLQLNHSDVHLIIALTAQSDTSNFPRCTYFRWSGHFRVSFVKGLFRDTPSNFCVRQHICYSAYMLCRLSVRPSACHTGGSVKNGWS